MGNVVNKIVFNFGQTFLFQNNIDGVGKENNDDKNNGRTKYPNSHFV